MSLRLILPALLVGLGLPVLAHADAVADLKAALGRMQATQPLMATLKVSSTVRGEDDKTTHAQLQVSVASGGDGLHIGFSPALLQRASTEAAANARNKDAPTPIEDLLGKLSPVSVQPMVDFAPVLLRQIDGATLSGQRDEMHEGKPAHLLVFDVPLPPSASKQMTIKQYTGQVMVWLGADGVPVAVRNVAQVKGRKFLISIEVGNTTDYALKMAGTRLIVLSRRSDETHSVFGKAGSSVTEAVLSLSPASVPAAG
ncbi:MAG TPA: hypothetical protein VN043_17970 [Rhodanobacter sp.]|nr:hypothetical protein [Rhodanobacter sp.]